MLLVGLGVEKGGLAWLVKVDSAEESGKILNLTLPIQKVCACIVRRSHESDC